jgi:hypothetical protein
MSVYTMRFASEDDYERWIQHAGRGINVLTIRSTSTMPDESFERVLLQESDKPVIVRYRTADRSLMPRAINRKRRRNDLSRASICALITIGAAILFYALI